MNIQPFDNRPFGARIPDFDCAAANPGEIEVIRAALHQHQLLVFPAQQALTPRQEVAFFKAIDLNGTTVWRDQVNNPWEVYKVEQGNQAGTYQLPGEPAVLVLGKGEIDHHGLRVTLGGKRGAYGKDSGSQVLGGGALQWHIDGSFYGQAPCHYTQMRCIEAPRGEGHWLPYDDGSGDSLWCAAGSTAFASGRLAFDTLAPMTRRACLNTRVHYAANPFQATYGLGNNHNGLRVVDPCAESQHLAGRDSAGDPVDDPLAQIYPLVWTCPVTRQQALMPHPRCLHSLEQKVEQGSDEDPHYCGLTESRFQVETLMRPAIAPGLVYVHPWQEGDLVLWNNRSIWHSATGALAPDDRRVMHLTAFNAAEPPRCVTDPAAD